MGVKAKRLFEFFKEHHVDEINVAEWEKFLGWMAEEHPGKRVSKIRDYLASFLKQCFEIGQIQKFPKLRNPDNDSEIGRALTEDEIAALLAEIKTDKLMLQVLMQLRMGMRGGEVLKLSIKSIDLKAGVVRLAAKDTKTRKSRSVPIPKTLLPLLKARLDTLKGNWLFPSFVHNDQPESYQGNREAFENACKRAGVLCRRHDLRHTCATNFARMGMAPMIACRILGMSLKIYDQVYCKPTEDDLKRAMG